MFAILMPFALQRPYVSRRDHVIWRSGPSKEDAVVFAGQLYFRNQCVVPAITEALRIVGVYVPSARPYRLLTNKRPTAFEIRNLIKETLSRASDELPMRK